MDDKKLDDAVLDELKRIQKIVKEPTLMPIVYRFMQYELDGYRPIESIRLIKKDYGVMR